MSLHLPSFVSGFVIGVLFVFGLLIAGAPRWKL